MYITAIKAARKLQILWSFGSPNVKVDVSAYVKSHDLFDAYIKALNEKINMNNV